MRELEPRLFSYIWRHSNRDQIAICAVVLASLPFYFASLDLPKRIVNDAIQQAEQRNPWQSSEGTEDGDDAPEW